MLSVAERTHIYLNFDNWKDLMILYLTCKTYKYELDSKYIIELLCKRHNMTHVDLSLSFHTNGRLNYDTDHLLATSCRNLDTRMVQRCFDIKIHIQMPLLDELLTIVIVKSSETQVGRVHPIIEILTRCTNHILERLDKYIAMAWNNEDDMLALYFYDMVRRHHSLLLKVIELMCKEGMLVGLKRSKEYWYSESLVCLDKALQYNKHEIISYLTTENERVKEYLAKCDTNKKYYSTQAYKCGSYYLANYIDPGRWIRK